MIHLGSLLTIQTDETVALAQIGHIIPQTPCVFCEAQVAGENKDSHLGIKCTSTSEGTKWSLVNLTRENNRLTLLLQSPHLQAEMCFTTYTNVDAIRISTRFTNILREDVVLEEAPTFRFQGFAFPPEKLYFTRFTQSHHGECQPVKHSFREWGLFGTTGKGQKSISFTNVGSWSTKEELPQGILEAPDGAVMFQIESNNGWHYEISDDGEEHYICMGGLSLQRGGWFKKLKPGASFETPPCALAFGKTSENAIWEMTKYRRQIAGQNAADADLPIIFNEYMHLSWDSPSEEKTKLYAPTVASLGIRYYVIDCGWHDEEDGNVIYPYVGTWRESNKRFPHGVKATADFIRSLGLKLGLWIEPEIIGQKCARMLDYYDDSCFLTRFGKKVAIMNRYFLDFRALKVRNYLSETIRYMVEDLGAEYIKLDYNEDIGLGTDRDAECFAEGLRLASRAYLDWIDAMRERFPHVLFETCSSGGMRMDYETLSHFSIVSTSDQTDYRKYPYIACNVGAAVLPEQAAVWSYPVDSYGAPNSLFSPTAEWVETHITDEQVIMNMINSFLGRMHLASHLELLSPKRLELVREGVAYFDSLSTIKKQAMPVFPLGFASFGAEAVAAGLQCGHTVFLSVYRLGGEATKIIPLPAPILQARISYPAGRDDVDFSIDNHTITVHFTQEYQARFFEVELSPVAKQHQQEEDARAEQSAD